MTTPKSTAQKKLTDVLTRRSIRLDGGQWYWRGNVTPTEMIANLIQEDSYFSKMIQADILGHLEKYAEDQVVVDTTPDEITGGVLSSSRVSLGFELHNFPHIPNDNDRMFIKAFYYHVSKSVVTYLFRNGLEYRIIPQTASGNIDCKEALLQDADFAGRVTNGFENKLNEWSTNIIRLYNENHTASIYMDEPINEYCLANIPITILSNCYITIKGVEYNAGTADEPITRIRATHVNISLDVAAKRRLSYSDFVELVINNHPLILNRLEELPKIYSNYDEAFSIFACDQYMVDEPVQLNKAWDEFFSKYTEDEMNIMLAMIWGVVFSKNKSRMGLWIYDRHGYSGKSAFLLAMTEILGSHLVGVIQKDSLSNQFGLAKIWDKRLVIYPDCKNTMFLHSEKFHQITGGDLAEVEDKGQKSFTVKMSAKMFIASNDLPQIDPSKKHERSRLVLVKPKITDKVLNAIAVKDANGDYVRDVYGEVVTVGDESFVSNLVLGKREMLINAYQAYRKLCPNNADYIVPDSVMRNIYALDTTERVSYEVMFQAIFEEDPNAKVSFEAIYDAYLYNCINNARYSNMKNNKEYGNFKTYLTKDKGLEVTRDNTQSRTRHVMGIKIRPEFILSMNSSISQKGF